MRPPAQLESLVVSVEPFPLPPGVLSKQHAAEFPEAGWRLSNPELPARHAAVSLGRGCGEGSEPPRLVLPRLAIHKRLREPFALAPQVGSVRKGASIRRPSRLRRSAPDRYPR